MKKLILILIAFISFYVNAQTPGSKYIPKEGDHTKYVTEEAYWREFVKSTDKLYRRTERVKNATDKTIRVVSRFTSRGKKVRLFYKYGKLIGRQIGNKMIHFYEPKSSKKRSSQNNKNSFSNRKKWSSFPKRKAKKTKTTSRNSTSRNNKFYRRQKGDQTSYITEKQFNKKYLRKKTGSMSKIMVITRRSKRGKKYTLFYKNKRLIGQLINGKFFKS